MLFKFPASEQEKKLVHEKMDELKKALSHSADLIEDLVACLKENELAISKEYARELADDGKRIGAKMFEIDCALYWIHYKNKPERVIESKAKEPQE
jgi:hypothetical protein